MILLDRLEEYYSLLFEPATLLDGSRTWYFSTSSKNNTIYCSSEVENLVLLDRLEEYYYLLFEQGRKPLFLLDKLEEYYYLLFERSRKPDTSRQARRRILIEKV